MKLYTFIASILFAGFIANAQLITIGPSTGAGSPGNVQASAAKILAGSGTNVYIDCRSQKDITIEVFVDHLGAGTDVCALNFHPVVDTATTNVLGPNIYQIGVAANGTTGAYAITNFTVSGYPYLKLRYISNSVAEVMTNVTIKYWRKQNAP